MPIFTIVRNKKGIITATTVTYPAGNALMWWMLLSAVLDVVSSVGAAGGRAGGGRRVVAVDKESSSLTPLMADIRRCFLDPARLCAWYYWRWHSGCDSAMFCSLQQLFVLPCFWASAVLTLLLPMLWLAWFFLHVCNLFEQLQQQ